MTNKRRRLTHKMELTRKKTDCMIREHNLGEQKTDYTLWERNLGLLRRGQSYTSTISRGRRILPLRRGWIGIGTGSGLVWLASVSGNPSMLLSAGGVDASPSMPGICCSSLSSDTNGRRWRRFRHNTLPLANFTRYDRYFPILTI